MYSSLFLICLLTATVHCLVPGRESDQITFDTNNDHDAIFETFSDDSLKGYSLRINKFNPDLIQSQEEKKSPIYCTNNFYTGYLDVTGSHSLFFWFLPSKTPKTSKDFLIWLNGGPGCSSTGFGNLFELGPCLITANRTTTPNPFAWNEETDLLFIDSPAAVGYSYNAGKAVGTSEETAKDLLAMTLLFYKAFDDIKISQKRLHIAGESYAGRYIPLLADTVRRYNEVGKGQAVNLKSIMIGNGLTSPAIQFASTLKMAGCDPDQKSPYPIFKVGSQECRSMTKSNENCQFMLSLCDKISMPFICNKAMIPCWNIYSDFHETGLNIYDLRTKCKYPPLCYQETAWIEEYMNRPDVRAALAVRPGIQFEGCNSEVYRAMALSGDGAHNSATQISALLESGVRVLTFAGTADFAVNAMGVSDWMEQLDSMFSDEYKSAPYKNWTVDGQFAGQIRQAGPGAGNYTFIAVDQAGHMVPMDQPKHALNMLHNWIHEQSFVTSD